MPPIHAAPDTPPPENLATALRAAEEAPGDDARWDALEEIAASLQRPDDVAALYRKIVADDTRAELVSRIGQRLVRFHDEWFDDAQPLVSVLTRVREVDPTADWAFHRLSLLLTNAERWEELLALYDRTLAINKDKSQRMQLLDEAAHIAKDFAGQPDRAIGYLEQLFPLKPSDSQLATSLERLFEKQQRFHDLIKLWSARLAVLPKDAALATRVRIASCWLDNLAQPGEALTATEALLRESVDDSIACDLLERIVALPASPPDVRRRGVSLLRDRYDAAKRGGDVVRVLEAALAYAERVEKIALHGEIAGRLMSQNRDAEAITHYSALVVLEPGATEARTRLRELAERTGAFDRYARALADAADACADPTQRIALRVEAANTRADTLADEPGAIELYALVLAASEADDATLLTVARRQAALLERAGRPREQLDVLERLATLERDDDEKRAALGRAARLADSLAETDRALAAWQRRLELSANDLEALDATVDILTRAERWEPLIAALRHRADASQSPDSRRVDLVSIARIHTERLAAVGAAIETWTEIESAFGQSAETVDALSELLATAERWKELAKLLDGAAERETAPARRAQLLHRLGDVQRERLDANKKAAKSYREALESDARNEGARHGLRALLSDDKCVAAATEALAKAYGETDEWSLTLEIVEPRLGVAKADDARTAILVEAARIHEQRANDTRAALGALRRAFPLSPTDVDLERDLLRLAEMTGGYPIAVDAYRDAIAAVSDNPARVADLYFQQGRILDEQLADAQAALEAYRSVTEIQPDRADATAALVRVGCHADRWDVVARAVVASAEARRVSDPTLFATVEELAAPKDAWDAVTKRFESALAKAKKLSGNVAREIETQLAIWHRDRRHDGDAAERALLRAIGHDASDAPTLRILADIQRQRPDRPLVDTLLRLAARTEDDHLDALFEAAEIVAKHLGDRELLRSTLRSLLDAAAARWTVSSDALGRHTPEEFASYAVEQLVALHTESGEHAIALDLLVHAATLPFSASASRALRHRAAQVAALQLNDAPRAIELYRGILAEAPDDAAAIAQLAILYEGLGRLEDLLALRRHELALGPSLERRLDLRLDIARVLGVLRDRAARIVVLRENLDEAPGHEASIAELTDVLETEADHALLTQLLAEQADRLERSDERASAARLWARVAHLAETRLDDVARALEAHRRVVAIGATHEALDALARLHTARGEHAAAVGWLELRLSSTAAPERAPTVVRLANAHLGTGRRDRALATLETALADDPSAISVRILLAEQYRSAASWEPLARLLRDGANHVEDAAMRLAHLREAAEIYHRRLDDAETAIPIAEQAVALAPQDRTVRTALADALRAAKRYDEARALLESLVAEFGRRRPPERAAVHYQLAQIARARGDLNEALTQLDTAASMDMQHADIQRMLGDLARDNEQLERAEKAYRALLLLVRRSNPDGAPPDAMGSSEVLFELYRLAARQGEHDRAREILESAFETASQSDLESRRFERALRAIDDPELLLRSLKARLARVQDPDVAATILIDLADVLSGLGRADEAFDASLKALEATPASTALHDATRDLSRKANAVRRYADTLGTLARRAKEQGEMGVACDLFIRLGELTERDLSAPAEAAEAYLQAESTGDRLVDVWEALDRVYGALGDSVSQARVLRQFVNAGVEESRLAEQTEAQFRLAEIELRTPDRRDDGAEMLSWALDRDPQHLRAASMLREVAEAAPDNANVVRLYERVARTLGDPAVLLDALERVSALPSATPEVFHEAVEIAASLDEPARVEALLRRAISTADVNGTLNEAIWALVALAERRKAADDLRDAVQWLRRAAEVAEPTEAFQYGLEVAQIAAGQLGDFRLAAETYEALRERDPGERHVWEPLLGVYRQLGEREKLAGLIAVTLDSVFDAGERNALRMERARLLLGEPGHEDDAVGVLRDILEEDPSMSDAAQLLIELFERTGRIEDMTDLVRRQLEMARDRGDGPLIGTLSQRLGSLIEQQSPSDAVDVYRAALEWAPENREILTSLLRLIGPDGDAGDRADVTEKLLAVERGEAAAALALELAAFREQQGDESGLLRVLELGFKNSPLHEGIRERLLRHYTDRGEHGRLAELLVRDASARGGERGVALYREAATIYRHRLENVLDAARTLQLARALVPSDLSLLEETTRALVEAGEPATAIAEVTSAVDAHRDQAAAQARLLKLRAELSLVAKNDAEAVHDLEDAVTLGGAQYLADLAAGLDRRRELLAERGERANERATVLRLLEVLESLQDAPRAEAVLRDWTQRDPSDLEAIRLLARMSSEGGRWETATEAYSLLVAIEAGDARIDAVLRLADAAERADRAGDARGALEQVHQAMPENADVRVRLRKLYEATGAHFELAEISMAEAEAASDEATRFTLLRRAGELRLKSGADPEAAVDALERALRIRAADHDTLVLLADGYTSAGRVADATSLLETAINGHKGRRSRELAALQHRMARVALSTGDRNVELAWLNVALDSDMQNGHIAAELADVAMTLGQTEVAMKALRAVTLMKNPGPMSRAMAFLKQGMLARTGGDARKAAFLAKKALAEDPQLDVAAAFLKELGE